MHDKSRWVHLVQRPVLRSHFAFAAEHRRQDFCLEVEYLAVFIADVDRPDRIVGLMFSVAPSSKKGKKKTICSTVQRRCVDGM